MVQAAPINLAAQKSTREAAGAVRALIIDRGDGGTVSDGASIHASATSELTKRTKVTSFVDAASGAFSQLDEAARVTTPASEGTIPQSDAVGESLLGSLGGSIPSPASLNESLEHIRSSRFRGDVVPPMQRAASASASTPTQSQHNLMQPGTVQREGRFTATEEQGFGPVSHSLKTADSPTPSQSGVPNTAMTAQSSKSASQSQESRSQLKLSPDTLLEMKLQGAVESAERARVEAAKQRPPFRGSYYQDKGLWNFERSQLSHSLGSMLRFRMKKARIGTGNFRSRLGKMPRRRSRAKANTLQIKA